MAGRERYHRVSRMVGRFSSWNLGRAGGEVQAERVILTKGGRAILTKSGRKILVKPQ